MLSSFAPSSHFAWFMAERGPDPDRGGKTDTKKATRKSSPARPLYRHCIDVGDKTNLRPGAFRSDSTDDDGSGAAEVVVEESRMYNECNRVDGADHRELMAPLARFRQPIWPIVNGGHVDTLADSWRPEWKLRPLRKKNTNSMDLSSIQWWVLL